VALLNRPLVKEIIGVILVAVVVGAITRSVGTTVLGTACVALGTGVAYVLRRRKAQAQPRT